MLWPARLRFLGGIGFCNGFSGLFCPQPRQIRYRRIGLGNHIEIQRFVNAGEHFVVVITCAVARVYDLLVFSADEKCRRHQEMVSVHLPLLKAVLSDALEPGRQGLDLAGPKDFLGRFYTVQIVETLRYIRDDGKGWPKLVSFINILFDFARITLHKD